MSDIDKLREMVDGYPDQIQQMEDSITELTAIAEDLQEQREAIENVVLAGLESDSDDYLDQLLIDLENEGKCGTLSGCTLTKGANYGVNGNLSDWVITKEVATTIPNPVPPPPTIPTTIQVPVSAGDDLTEGDQYQRQEDSLEAYDHIWKEVDETGTYGIKHTRDNVNTGKGIVEINKAKIETVLEIYEKFT